MKYSFSLVLLLAAQLAFAQKVAIKCINPSHSLGTFRDFVQDSSDAKQPQFYFLGESHGVAITTELYFNLVAGLNQRGNFHNLICERSYAETLLFNRFLQSGDTALLVHDVAWGADMKIQFNKFRDLNQSLPEGRKLNFIGVDAIHSAAAFVLAIQTLLPIEEPPIQIKKFVDSLKFVKLPLAFRAKSSAGYFGFMDDMRDELKTHVTQHAEAYRAYLKDDFMHMEAIISSNSSYSRPGSRNKEMFNNFLFVLKRQGLAGSFVGLFGDTHVMKLNSINPSFASLLHENDLSPLQNSVYRIIIHYENCYSNFRDKIVLVPSVLEVFYKKKASNIILSLLRQSDCRNFVMRVPDEMPELRKNCEYLIFVSDSKPLSRNN